MNELLPFLPDARRDGIITKEVDDEVLVYDQVHEEAHCLNKQAAAVWRLCDGRTTPVEIAKKLKLYGENKEASGIVTERVDEDIVYLALAELHHRHLLEVPRDIETWPNKFMGIPRREAIRRIGLGAAIAIPIITSMTVPTAVEAAVSCKAQCSPCSAGQCCSGVCGPAASVGCPGSGNKCA
ncbi:MAG TPA: PqqD family protein [Pyrinomonadaceae bacterium]|nr:PqqD family protein [Pyrinomonadaceae bacterium]